jgi:hypothetical protein
VQITKNDPISCCDHNFTVKLTRDLNGRDIVWSSAHDAISDSFLIRPFLQSDGLRSPALNRYIIQMRPPGAIVAENPAFRKIGGSPYTERDFCYPVMLRDSHVYRMLPVMYVNALSASSCFDSTRRLLNFIVVTQTESWVWIFFA